jgi:hypothetical protein
VFLEIVEEEDTTTTGTTPTNGEAVVATSTTATEGLESTEAAVLVEQLKVASAVKRVVPFIVLFITVLVL